MDLIANWRTAKKPCREREASGQVKPRGNWVSNADLPEREEKQCERGDNDKGKSHRRSVQRGTEPGQPFAPPKS
jgi:hypothetical protein